MTDQPRPDGSLPTPASVEDLIFVSRGSRPPTSHFKFLGAVLVEACQSQLQRGRWLFGLEAMATVSLSIVVPAISFFFATRSDHTQNWLGLAMLCAFGGYLFLRCWLRESRRAERQRLDDFQRQLRDMELAEIAVRVADDPAHYDKLVGAMKAGFRDAKGQRYEKRRIKQRKKRSLSRPPVVTFGARLSHPAHSDGRVIPFSNDTRRNT